MTTFPAGETITVEWTETVPHPGYFRISFDADGMDDFVDPPEPRATGYSDTVLADNLHHQDTGFQRFGQMPAHYSAEVTLPNIACDTCTLQLIQFMEDKLNDGNPDNDIYYSCADIVLVAGDGSEAADGNGSTGDTDTEEPAGPESPDAATDAPSSSPDGGGGCSLAGPGSSSRVPSSLIFGFFLLTGSLTLRRRASGDSLPPAFTGNATSKRR